jgi:hypothetical protein
MTKPIYEVITNDLGEVMIKRTDANGTVWWIPPDPTNSDYQAYLNKDKAEQSTPSVIDEA